MLVVVETRDGAQLESWKEETVDDVHDRALLKLGEETEGPVTVEIDGSKYLTGWSFHNGKVFLMADQENWGSGYSTGSLCDLPFEDDADRAEFGMKFEDEAVRQIKALDRMYLEAKTLRARTLYQRALNEVRVKLWSRR